MPESARDLGEQHSRWQAPKMEGITVSARETKKPSVDEAVSQAEALIQRRISRTGGSHTDIAINAGRSFVTALRGADALRDNKAIVAAEDRLLAFLENNRITGQDQALKQFEVDLSALGVDVRAARREVAQTEEMPEPTTRLTKEVVQGVPDRGTERRVADIVSIEAARARAAKAGVPVEARSTTKAVEPLVRVVGDDDWAKRAKQAVVSRPVTQNPQLTQGSAGGVFSKLWNRIRGG